MSLFISANNNQGNEIFSPQSRGKQCAFISISALLTARHIPLMNWTSTIFDNVLFRGDEMYLQSLNGSLILENARDSFLSLDELPKFFNISYENN